MRTADVARAIHCNVCTVRCLRQHYRETGQTADHPRSGRPCVTTPAQDRYIRTSHLWDRYRMATTARITPGTHNPSISAQTVHNRLRERVDWGLVGLLGRSSPDITSDPPSLDQTGLAKSYFKKEVRVCADEQPTCSVEISQIGELNDSKWFLKKRTCLP
jgi:hypothetical protein